MSAADRAFAEKAKASGTSFQSRGAATDSFKQKYANTYTSRYASEPSNRPTHIPTTTIYNNHSYSVVYDRTYGGYGYYIGSRWYYYDAFTDAVMLSSLMHTHSYYYPTYDAGGPVVVADWGYGWYVLWGVFGFIILIVIIGVIVENRR